MPRSMTAEALHLAAWVDCIVQSGFLRDRRASSAAAIRWFGRVEPECEYTSQQIALIVGNRHVQLVRKFARRRSAQTNAVIISSQFPARLSGNLCGQIFAASSVIWGWHNHHDTVERRHY